MSFVNLDTDPDLLPLWPHVRQFAFNYSARVTCVPKHLVNLELRVGTGSHVRLASSGNVLR